MLKNRAKRIGITAAVTVFVILAVALAIDPVATLVANKQLDKASGIMGHVEKVHLSFLGLRAEISDFNLQITRGEGSLPVVAVKSVSVDADGAALLHGVIKLSALVEEPHVTLWRELIEDTDLEEVKESAKEKAPAPSIAGTLRELMPFKVDDFEVTHGIIRFRDPSVNPSVDLQMDNLHLQVHNLTNRSALKDEFFADAHLEATPLTSGSLNVDVKFDPLQEEPTLKMNAELRGLPLTRLNDALRAYTKFEVEGGEAAMFAEYAARKGNFKGYVKPAFTHVKVHPWKSGLEGKPFEKFWRSIVGGIVELFASKPEQQVAAKLPAEGHFEDPDIGIAQAVLSLLKNGFIEALMQNLDHTISLGGVATE